MLSWKMLERLCVQRMAWEERNGNGSMKRAGVTGAQLIGRPELNKDVVDFVGKAQGIPFKLDCKTCGNASFSLHEDFFKRGQYEELKAFDGVAFILLHFNPRRLETCTVDAATFAFPVRADMEFWVRYEMGNIKSIRRTDCISLGVAVKWEQIGRFQTLLPDIVSAVKALNGFNGVISNV